MTKLKKGQCRIRIDKFYASYDGGPGSYFYIDLWTGDMIDGSTRYKAGESALRAARRLAADLGLEVIE